MLYTGTVICARASIYKSASLFTACLKIGVAWFTMFLKSCTNIFVWLSNILSQSRFKLIHSMTQLTEHLCSVLWLQVLLSILGDTDRPGVGVPFCKESVVFPGVLPSSVHVGGIVTPSSSMGVGRTVRATLSVSTGGILRGCLFGSC